MFRERSSRKTVSAELAIIISYPTSASGIIVLIKTPPKYRKLDYNKNKEAQKITHTLAIFVNHGIMALIIHQIFSLVRDWSKHVT